MATELEHETSAQSRSPRRAAHDPLCVCGHGRSAHGAAGSGTRECLACDEAVALGLACPAGARCHYFVEIGRVA